MGDLTVSEEDSRRYSEAAADAARTSREALATAEEFAKRIGSLKGREGISLLEVKARDLLAYAREMAVLMAKMSLGQSIEGDEAIVRNVKHRTVLEKVRVLEKKMASQIERLTDAAAGKDGTERMRARPEEMELDDSGEDEEDEGEGASKAKKKGDAEAAIRKYVPPKVMAMHYDEDEDSREDKRKALARRKAAQSSLVQELRAQYSEAPEEITDRRRSRRPQEQERTAYEEEFYMRTQLSKKDRSEARKEERESALDSLLQFGNYMAGDDDELKRRERLRKESAVLKDKRGGKGGKRKGRPFKGGGPGAKRFKSGPGMGKKSKRGGKR